jgi:hypothetical protein
MSSMLLLLLLLLLLPLCPSHSPHQAGGTVRLDL